MRRLWPLVLALGCSEQGLSSLGADDIAVVTGDFDDVTEPLGRMVVPYDLFDGVTSVATWDPDYDPETHSLVVESLLRDHTQLDRYQLVLVASGTRGLGETVYNGVDPDDDLVADPTVRANVERFVAGGRTLMVTDWAYDLVEAVWPGKLDPVGDDTVYDAAQTGMIGTTTATVTDQRLVDAVGGPVVAIDYDYSNWAPVRAVADDVTVWLTGDVSYRLPGSEVVETLPDAPLLVSWEVEGGRVVYATFHVSAQTDAVADGMYRTLLGPLPEGADTGVAR